MNRMTLSLFFVFILNLFIVQPTTAGMQMPHITPDDIDATFEMLSQMTPEEMEELERMTEEAMKDPEFRKYVEQETKRLEKVFSGEEAPEQRPKTRPEPTKPERKQVPKKIEPSKPKIRAKKKTVELINEIISHTNKFLSAAQSWLEFPEEVKDWAKKGKIRTWRPSFSWNDLKKDIEKATQKIHILKDRNPKTKQYKHIDELSKNKELIDTLKALHGRLDQHVSKIEVPVYKKKAKDSSQKAMTEFISAYMSALQPFSETRGLIMEIDALIALYESTATEIKTKEEKAAQEALGLSKRQPRMEKVRVSKEEASRDFGATPQRTRRLGGGGGGIRRDFGAPAFRPTSRRDAGVRGTQPRQEISTKKSPTKKTTSEETSEKEEPKKESPVSSKYKEDAAVRQEIQTVTSYLERVEDITERNTKFKNLRAHLLNSKEGVDKDLAIEHTPQIIKNFKRATEHINTLFRYQLDQANEKDRNRYRSELKDIVKRFSNLFDDLTNQIQDIKSDWSKIESKVSGEKKHAYIDRKKYEKEASKELEDTYPRSLYDISNEIKKMNDAIHSMGQKKD